MSVRRSLIPLALAVLATRCADGPAPTAVQPPSAPAPHFLQWAGSSPPQFTAIGPFSGAVVNGVFLTAPPGGLSLAQYTAAFWAVRGQSRSVQINYQSALGAATDPFLVLTITDPDSVPGLGGLAVGDSVLVTVTVDTTKIGVSFEPTGLHFATPAQLQIWYAGAGGDLNGDGVVDSTDAYIESQLLGMWYREGAASLWERILAVQSLSDKSFISALPHFSEYAVSW